MRIRPGIARSSRPVLLIGLFCLLGLLIGAYVFVWPSEDARLRQARADLAMRDFSAALKRLDDYLDHYPNDLSARILAAQAARRGHDYDQARRQLRRFELDDGPPLALELEERLLAAQQGDAAQAELLSEFCQANPSASEAPLALEAIIVADLDRLSRPLEIPKPFPLDDQPPALKRLLQSVERWLVSQSSAADQVEGHVWRGRAREMAGDHPGAQDDFRRALELDPEHFDARAYYALSEAQENPRESIAQYERLAVRWPNDVRLTFSLATSHRGVGDLDEAQRLLDEILRDRPRNSQVLLERAQVSLDQRDPQSAKVFLDRAAAAGPETAALHLVFVRYMTMIGDSAGAKKHQARFQELDAERADR